ncbi:hypothetical protein [uncultured Akkermansia sp.]|uniref:hypothetical protein n=1 Tax=uncultured Akkermansia sp. TaxID=512294 RepID=UPI00265CD503|nr:hypothetical protein [uncultured Akkermansia sp.]
MSNFRILILVFLVVVLAVLGMIYVNISSRMDVIQQQQQIAPAPVPAAVTPSSYIPVPTQAPGNAVQPVVVADPVVSEELAHATAELERMKKENEELKKRRAMAEEERALLERKSLEKGDPRLQWLNEIKDAEQVGRVTEYYRDANLVLFQSIGQPNLKVGQELGIRRRGSIFVSLIIDGVDPDGKVFQSYVKRNTLFDNNDKETIKPGDEVIVPPASWQENMPAGGESGADPAAVPSPAAPPQPVMIPMEP